MDYFTQNKGVSDDLHYLMDLHPFLQRKKTSLTCILQIK